MGNSVSDFKEGSYDQFRDRIKKDVKSDIGSPWNSSSPPSSTKYSAGSLSRCVDVNHPLFYASMRRRSSGRFPKMRNLDFGSSFSKESSEITMPAQVFVSRDRISYTEGYKGIYFPSNAYKLAMLQAASNGNFPTIPLTLGNSRGGLTTLGSTAIAKSIPDVPDFSLFRFIGELREGLPKIPLATLAKQKKVRNIGGEYLNVQFGVMPLISDLQKLVERMANPHFRSALARQVQKEFRVRKVLEKSETRTSRPMTSGERTIDARGQTAVAGTIETVESVRIWSSCSFSYYQFRDLQRLLDEWDDNLGGMGVIPTAIDFWNLIPWSWLVDWFSNFNHVATNLSYLGKDGLYLQRAYIMAHYSKKEIHSQRSLLYLKPFETTGTLIQERKYRIKASPFGFGYTWKDFDPFQLSILGALGVSRMRF